MTVHIPKIRVRGLKKSFAGKVVLAGVDLDIPQHENVVLLGVSGSGKTTLMKCLLGLVPPDAGRIEIDGRDLDDMLPHERSAFRRKTGVMFQKGALFDSLPIWQNIGFALLNVDHRPESAVREVAMAMLAKVALGPDIADLRPGELSGGMQKRVALARALVSEPEVLFLDCPTDGLDPILTTLIDLLLCDVGRQLRAATLSITQDLASARRIAQRVALLSEGRIVWEGGIGALDNSGHLMIQQLARSGQRTAGKS
jgi:phospholipid/cholesterol/gamma-HCH transport system ATP-binding protein